MHYKSTLPFFYRLNKIEQQIMVELDWDDALKENNT